MANVRNNHDAALSVGGVRIRAGATSAVSNWSPEVATEPERALLNAKRIEVVADRAEEEKPTEDSGRGKAKAKS